MTVVEVKSDEVVVAGHLNLTLGLKESGKQIMGGGILDFDFYGAAEGFDGSFGISFRMLENADLVMGSGMFGVCVEGGGKVLTGGFCVIGFEATALVERFRALRGRFQCLILQPPCKKELVTFKGGVGFVTEILDAPNSLFCSLCKMAARLFIFANGQVKLPFEQVHRGIAGFVRQCRGAGLERILSIL